MDNESGELTRLISEKLERDGTSEKGSRSLVLEKLKD